MRKVFIHIGQHKTGTTRIQYALARSSSVLEKQNYEYPLLSAHAAHDYLHRYCVDIMQYGKSDLEGRVSELIKNIKCFDGNVIISAEGLQEVDPELLRKIFSEFDVVIVAYVREQADYLFSAYLQEVKSGGESRTFPEWIESMGKHIGAYYPYSWLNSWEAAFGVGCVIVRIYDRSSLVDGDVLADFLQVVGLQSVAMDIGATMINEPSNLRVNQYLHEAMRVINSLGFPRKMVLDVTYDAIERLSQSAPKRHPLPGCNPILVEEIRRRSDYENVKLFDKYFDGIGCFDLKELPVERRSSSLMILRYLISVLAFSFWRNKIAVVRIFFRLMRFNTAIKLISFDSDSRVSGLGAMCSILNSSLRK